MFFYFLSASKHTHTHTLNYMRLESLVSLFRSVSPVLRLVTNMDYLKQVY